MVPSSSFVKAVVYYCLLSMSSVMSDPSCYDFSGDINGTPNRCVCNAQYCNEPACTAAGGIWTDGCNSCSCSDYTDDATPPPVSSSPTSGSPACYDPSGDLSGTANSCVCTIDFCQQSICEAGGGIWATTGCSSCSCDEFCYDDSEWVWVNNNNKERDCAWVAKKPGDRCDKPGAVEACCACQ